MRGDVYQVFALPDEREGNADTGCSGKNTC